LRRTAAFAMLEGSISELAASGRFGRRRRSWRFRIRVLTALGWFRTCINMTMF